MNHVCVKAVAAFAIAAVILSFIPVVFAQDTELSYQLLDQPEGNTHYKLGVVIPQQLNTYYASESHRLSTANDFAKFITPYALKPVADRLWQIYNTDEDFTNGVLMLVHQITYEETMQAYYPTETMAAGKGDCDLLAYVAASILKAGGLNVVLFYYEDQEHMNIGVELANPPSDNRGNDYYVEFNGVTYYVAECTGGNWKQGWRVGECPDDYRDVSTQVIQLDGIYRVDPGQVSASFNVMEASTLSIDVSPLLRLENSNLTITGQIFPQLPNQNVTLYARTNLGSWEVIGTTQTGINGRYEFVWQSQTGIYYQIQASWPGNDNYVGALSSTKNAVLLPTYLTMLLSTAIAAVFIGTYAVIQRNRKRKTVLPIQNPATEDTPTVQPDYQI